MDATKIVVVEKKLTDANAKTNLASAAAKKKATEDKNAVRKFAPNLSNVQVFYGFLFLTCGREVRLRTDVGGFFLGDGYVLGIHFLFVHAH